MNCLSLSFDRKRLTRTTLSLCLAAATHSFLLFSFFPYAGYMAVTLLDNSSSNIISSNVTVVTVDNVGIYAGMLGASFTLGRFLGFVPWKVARNILGEKHALVLSLLMTGLTSLWIGLCTTFPGALVARLAQGVSNCISGSVKRAAINARYNDNLVSKRALIVIVGSDQSQKYEGNSRQKTTSKEVYYDYDSNPPEVLVLSVMWWGTALGPIVGGLLSDPGFLGSFFELDSDSSTWYASYPYLLSNGFSAMLCWLSMVCVAVFTTDLPPRNSGSTSTPVGEQRPLLAPPSTRSSSTDKTATRRLWESFWTLWRTNKDARYHLIAYWSFSFVAVCCDEALPLFLITSKESTGLGLSEGRVGLLLSSTGLIVAASHHAALDKVFDTENGARDGMYRVLTACALFGNVTAVLVPLSLLLNDYDYGGDGNYNESNNNNNKSVLLGLTKTSFLYLVFILAFLRGSASVYFSLIGMATGRTLRVVHKDEAARIMTIGALLVRSLAPIIAGGVLSHFMATKPSVVTNTASSPSPLHSSWMVWIVIGLVFGLAAATNTFFLAAKQSGSGGMTENQRTYFANRLVRVRMRSLGSFYGSASKSICSRWNDCTSFVRLARKKAVTSGKRRNRTVVITSNNEPNEVVNKDAALIGKKQHTWKEHTVAPGVDFDIVSFFIIGTHKKDTRCVPHVLAPPIMDALQKNLPMNCSESNFWLKYSLIRDGASMHSIEAKSGLARNTILAIETLNGDVFGCFMTKPWMPTNNHYRRSNESFLWRLKKRRGSTTAEDEESPELLLQAAGDDDDIIDVYPWTGNNDLCQLVADDKIACGGGVVGNHGDGFGILLNKDLQSGSSSPCATYENPSLCGSSSGSDENRFEVANIEIWSLIPYMFVADAERSEQALQFIKDNSESPSSTSAWSNFL